VPDFDQKGQLFVPKRSARARPARDSSDHPPRQNDATLDVLQADPGTREAPEAAIHTHERSIHCGEASIHCNEPAIHRNEAALRAAIPGIAPRA
jgi:hypothetical protein